MNILVTGATGFIASQIVADLVQAGHRVTCAVRDIRYAEQIFPHSTIILCDFIKDTKPDLWAPRLKNIDMVINCVGILYHPNKKIIWAVHHETPKALFDACVKTNVKKIIHISALAVDKSTVEYAKSKKATDDYLRTLPICSTILRPSFVYGRGSYAGSSLFRGLAGLPWIIPVPGKGEQLLQPIHVEDLSKAVLRLIENPSNESMILNAVGPKPISLKEILITLRSWLGFSKARITLIPFWLIRLGSFLGDFIPYSSMNSSSIKMIAQNNIATEEDSHEFQMQIGFVPRDFSSAVFSQPSTVQDHWHARLFFLKPALQFSIAFVWIAAALCSAFVFSKSATYEFLTQLGMPKTWQPLFLYTTSAVEALLGLAMLFWYQLKKVCLLQITLIIIFSAIITIKAPQLWLHPLGPITKNLPLIVATLAFLAMRSDR
jgi:nucleoside-diphosphate-sugar epimerase